MSTKETGESAFPTDGDNYGPKWSNPGMTLRQYAAIKLKVPDSGEDWLDAMILAALRNDFAAKAMPLAANLDAEYRGDQKSIDAAYVAALAFEIAETMLKARQ